MLLARAYFTSLAHGIETVERDASDWRAATELVEPVAERFARYEQVRRADARESAGTLAALRIPELPEAAPDEQRAFFDALRPQAAALTEVWIVESRDGDLPVAVAPVSGLLVLPMDSDAYL